jgi:hypothetical protein
MYLVISHFPLAHAKKRFETMDQVKLFILEIIEKTNLWRMRLRLEPYRLQRCVTASEAIDCIRVLKIDPELCNEAMIGEELPITCEIKSPKTNIAQDELDQKARQIRRS